MKLNPNRFFILIPILSGLLIASVVLAGAGESGGGFSFVMSGGPPGDETVSDHQYIQGPDVELMTINDSNGDRVGALVNPGLGWVVAADPSANTGIFTPASNDSGGQDQSPSDDAM